MRAHDKAVIHGSKDCDWMTPEPMASKLQTYFRFGVDLAASMESQKGPFYFGPDRPEKRYRDALAIPSWLAVLAELNLPRVGFLNPPYSVEQYRSSKKAGTVNDALKIENWIAKVAQEAAAGLTIAAILPASVQTRWWSRYVWGSDLRAGDGVHAAEIWTIPHRVTFEPSAGMVLALEQENRARARDGLAPKTLGSAGGNTAVVIWRPDPGYVGAWVPVVRPWTYRDPKPVGKGKGAGARGLRIHLAEVRSS